VASATHRALSRVEPRSGIPFSLDILSAHNYDAQPDATRDTVDGVLLSRRPGIRAIRLVSTKFTILYDNLTSLMKLATIKIRNHHTNAAGFFATISDTCT
jgi:hypothetical protein